MRDTTQAADRFSNAKNDFAQTKPELCKAVLNFVGFINSSQHNSEASVILCGTVVVAKGAIFKPREVAEVVRHTSYRIGVYRSHIQAQAVWMSIELERNNTETHLLFGKKTNRTWPPP